MTHAALLPPARPRLADARAVFGGLLERPGPALVRHRDGQAVPLPLERYLGAATAVDDLVLDACRGPVLDIGCGPGRILDGLRERGIEAVGVDHSPAAVRLARDRGRRVVAGCVFDADLPGAGRWATALLLDGNVGIGGDPARLLRRVRDLLAPAGTLVVEVAPPGVPTRPGPLRLEAGGAVSAWFPWATVGADGVAAVAAAAGLHVRKRFGRDDRWFACLG